MSTIEPKNFSSVNEITEFLDSKFSNDKKGITNLLNNVWLLSKSKVENDKIVQALINSKNKSSIVSKLTLIERRAVDFVEANDLLRSLCEKEIELLN